MSFLIPADQGRVGPMSGTPFICPDCGREHFPFCNGPAASRGGHPAHLSGRGRMLGLAAADHVQLEPMGVAHSLVPFDAGGGGLLGPLPRPQARNMYGDPVESSFLLSRGAPPPFPSPRMNEYPLKPLLPSPAMAVSPVGSRGNAFSPGPHMVQMEGPLGYSTVEMRERRWEGELSLRQDAHSKLMAERHLQSMQGVGEIMMPRGDEYVQRAHLGWELEATDRRPLYGSLPSPYQRRMQILEPLLRAGYSRGHMRASQQEHPLRSAHRDNPEQFRMWLPFDDDIAASNLRVLPTSFSQRDGLLPHHSDPISGFQSDPQFVHRMDAHRGPLHDPGMERLLDLQFERRLSPWPDRPVLDSQLPGRQGPQLDGQLNDPHPVVDYYPNSCHSHGIAVDHSLDRELDYATEKKLGRNPERPTDRSMGRLVDYNAEQSLGSQLDRRDHSLGRQAGHTMDRNRQPRDQIGDQRLEPQAELNMGKSGDSEGDLSMSQISERVFDGNLKHNLDQHGAEWNRDGSDHKLGQRRDNKMAEDYRPQSSPSNHTRDSWEPDQRLQEQRRSSQPSCEERSPRSGKSGKDQVQSLSDLEKTSLKHGWNKQEVGRRSDRRADVVERHTGKSHHAAADIDRESREGEVRRRGIGQESSQTRKGGDVYYVRDLPTAHQGRHHQQRDQEPDVAAADARRGYDARPMEDGNWQRSTDATASAVSRCSTPAVQSGFSEIPGSERRPVNEPNNAQRESQVNHQGAIEKVAAATTAGMKWDTGPYASVYGSFLQPSPANAAVDHLATDQASMTSRMQPLVAPRGVFTGTQQGPPSLVGSQLESTSSGNGFVQGSMPRGPTPSSLMLPPVSHSSEDMTKEIHHVADVYPVEGTEANSLYMTAGAHIPSGQALHHPVMVGAPVLPAEATPSPSSRAVIPGEAFSLHQPLQQTSALEHTNPTLGMSVPAAIQPPPDIVFHSQMAHENERALAPPYVQMGVMPLVQQQQPQTLPEKKHKVIDATSIFRKPGRDRRPSRFVVILRGLPGSGKSYLAKALRDVEVMNGGSPPRIHSMDDYFMIEVEKEVDVDNGVSTKSSSRTKRKILTKVKEYCYEPEMEEVYKASMFKAFKKTLEEGRFTFIIVDDRNVLVADFSQYWAAAKMSGYEVYVLDATFKDPIACSVRNVHGFSEEHILSMAAAWEPTPLHHLVLDVSSLFRGDDLGDNGITEVEMDAADMGRDLDEPDDDYKGESFRLSAFVNDALHREVKDGEKKDDDNDDDDISDDVCKSKKMEVFTLTTMQNGKLSGSAQPTPSSLLKPGSLPSQRQEGVGSIKRKVGDMQSSNGGRGVGTGDNDNEDDSDSDDGDDGGNALSGLMKAYGKTDKRVRWADLEGQKQLAKGFTIGASLAKRTRLEIGPGAGYNEAETSKLDDELPGGESDSEHMYSKSKFREQLRAEQETFRAVLARRRQRIEAVDDDDD